MTNSYLCVTHSFVVEIFSRKRMPVDADNINSGNDSRDDENILDYSSNNFMAMVLKIIMEIMQNLQKRKQYGAICLPWKYLGTFKGFIYIKHNIFSEIIVSWRNASKKWHVLIWDGLHKLRVVLDFRLVNWSLQLVVGTRTAFTRTGKLSEWIRDGCLSHISEKLSCPLPINVPNSKILGGQI